MLTDIYQGIFNNYRGLPLTKGQKTKTNIVESLIVVYAKLGAEKATLSAIAKESKISRPLIVHYFRDKDEIFEYAVKLTRVILQNYVTSRMEHLVSAEELMKVYFYSVFEWLDDYPMHYKFWLDFYKKCSVDESHISLNSELTEMGRKRIQKIIELGIDQGVFTSSKPFIHAKTIQTIMTGGCLLLETEDMPIERREYIDDLYETICNLLSN